MNTHTAKIGLYAWRLKKLIKSTNQVNQINEPKQLLIIIMDTTMYNMLASSSTLLDLWTQQWSYQESSQCTSCHGVGRSTVV